MEGGGSGQTLDQLHQDSQQLLCLLLILFLLLLLPLLLLFPLIQAPLLHRPGRCRYRFLLRPHLIPTYHQGYHISRHTLPPPLLPHLPVLNHTSLLLLLPGRQTDPLLLQPLYNTSLMLLHLLLPVKREGPLLLQSLCHSGE